MSFYTVKWQIQVDAPTPLAAARMALKIQRDPESIATVFDVFGGATGDNELPDDYLCERVDLSAMSEEC